MTGQYKNSYTVTEAALALNITIDCLRKRMRKIGLQRKWGNQYVIRHEDFPALSRERHRGRPTASK